MERKIDIKSPKSLKMHQTWRWFGPSDPVSLSDIKQAGAKGIVTALHEVPIGEVWTPELIKQRKDLIEWNQVGSQKKPSGLKWDVIESIPVHEDIKQGKPGRDHWIEKYKESIKNVGQQGISVLTYNWMPVVDWTRTNLTLELADGAKVLHFDRIEYIAFDLFVLERKDAAKDYTDDQVESAKKRFDSMHSDQILKLQKTIIAGLPGGQEGYSINDFKLRLAEYVNIDADKYRENLKYFLEQIVPVAKEHNVKLAIHPDDPPFSLFGLPRIVSTESDLQMILGFVDSIYNGLCFCTGSLGVRADNDLPGMVQRFGDKINFLHLRSTQRDPDGSFHEAAHLDGDVNMYEVVLAVFKQHQKRLAANRKDVQIPMRPDHGHTILDDLQKNVNPGYAAIGRLKGLAEIRGLELGIISAYEKS